MLLHFLPPHITTTTLYLLLAPRWPLVRLLSPPPPMCTRGTVADVMCSSAYTLKETNCIETSVADVSAFESPFELTVNKAWVCSVLRVYFGIIFETNLGAPVFFSTGPAATPAHWKQTLFYLKQPLTVADGKATRSAPSFCHFMPRATRTEHQTAASSCAPAGCCAYTECVCGGGARLCRRHGVCSRSCGVWCVCTLHATSFRATSWRARTRSNGTRM
jgi:hypothetical protein